MQNAFVKSGNASDIYHLQEINIPIASNQQELTPFQRQVLVQEKIRQNEREQEEIDQARSGNAGSPPSRGTGSKPNARSGKVDAIKKSQQEQDRFINKSLMEDNNE